MKRVVVTGATGNVGTSVIKVLSRDTHVDSLIGVARRSPSKSVPKVKWVEADVASADLGRIVSGADAIVHLAWAIQPSHRPELLRRINVEGSKRVFRAAADKGVGCVIYASSVGTYSPGPKDRVVDFSTISAKRASISFWLPPGGGRVESINRLSSASKVAILE